MEEIKRVKVTQSVQVHHTPMDSAVLTPGRYADTDHLSVVLSLLSPEL